MLRTLPLVFTLRTASFDPSGPYGKILLEPAAPADPFDRLSLPDGGWRHAVHSAEAVGLLWTMEE